MAASGLLSATSLALGDASEAWMRPERPTRPAPESAFERLFELVAARIPAADADVALGVLALLLTLGIGAAVTWLAYQLFRGPGRPWGALAAGPVAVLAVAHWLRDVEVGAAFPALPFTLLAIVAVGPLVRSLVHLGQLTPAATMRVLAGAAAASAVWPRPGLPLLALLTVICLARDLRRTAAAARDREGARPSIPPVVIAVVRRWWPIAGATILVGLMTTLAVHGTLAVDAGLGVPRLGPPPLAELRAHLGTYLVYPGLALVVVMVLPLRWRGGLELAVLTVGALFVADADGPLAPLPLQLAAIAVSASGWIWLAGLLVPRRMVARGLAVVATAAVAVLGTLPSWDEVHPVDGLTPLAEHRVGPSLLVLHDRGLLVPGDVAIVHGPKTRASLLWQQRTAGARPDVLVVDPAVLHGPALAEATPQWTIAGRRVLSDSFTLGGRWQATWAIDAGPWYWFIGAIAEEERAFSDLVAPLPADADADEVVRWERFHVERARFRRSVSHSDAALEALPVDQRTRERLLHAYRIAGMGRPVPESASEHGGVADVPGARPLSLSLTEAGDLLYGVGIEELGGELLAEAARMGSASAVGVLARWQIRAGHENARRTVAALAGDPALRMEATELLQWGVARERTSDALEIRARLKPSTSAVAEEIGARIAVLHMLAR